MENNNGWGGKRPGAGRPQQTKKLKVGDTFAAKRHYSDGGQALTEIWEVSEVDRTSLTLKTRDGDTIILIK